MKIYRLMILFSLILLSYSCKRRLTNEEIYKFQWKWYDGAHFGDFIPCDIYNCQIKDDTLYTFGAPAYIILEAYEDKWVQNEKMKIIEIASGDTATYIGK